MFFFNLNRRENIKRKNGNTISDLFPTNSKYVLTFKQQQGIERAIKMLENKFLRVFFVANLAQIRIERRPSAFHRRALSRRINRPQRVQNMKFYAPARMTRARWHFDGQSPSSVVRQTEPVDGCKWRQPRSLWHGSANSSTPTVRPATEPCANAQPPAQTGTQTKPTRKANPAIPSEIRRIVKSGDAIFPRQLAKRGRKTLTRFVRSLLSETLRSIDTIVPRFVFPIVELDDRAYRDLSFSFSRERSLRVRAACQRSSLRRHST